MDHASGVTKVLEHRPGELRRVGSAGAAHDPAADDAGVQATAYGWSRNSTRTEGVLVDGMIVKNTLVPAAVRDFSIMPGPVLPPGQPVLIDELLPRPAELGSRIITTCECPQRSLRPDECSEQLLGLGEHRWVLESAPVL